MRPHSNSSFFPHGFGCLTLNGMCVCVLLVLHWQREYEQSCMLGGFSYIYSTYAHMCAYEHTQMCGPISWVTQPFTLLIVLKNLLMGTLSLRILTVPVRSRKLRDQVVFGSAGLQKTPKLGPKWPPSDFLCLFLFYFPISNRLCRCHFSTGHIPHPTYPVQKSWLIQR